jgi:GNAT superfamily N-acetyltransferase
MAVPTCSSMVDAMRLAIGLLAAAALAGAGAAADEPQRQLGAHEHGHSTLNIAIEGGTIELELISPGADIVGFEHPAESEADRAAVAAAEARLADPLSLFVLPAAAGCSIGAAEVEIEAEGRAHEAGHEAEAAHSEFRAAYRLTCADTGAVATIGFAFFDAFPNAREIEVTVVSPRGQSRYEVERAAPTLELAGQS